MKHHLLQTSLACILMLLFYVGAMAQTQTPTQVQAQTSTSAQTQVQEQVQSQIQGQKNSPILTMATADVTQAKDKAQSTTNNTPRTTLTAQNNPSSQYTLSTTYTETYTQFQPVNLSLSGIRLVADSGSLMHDVTFSVSTLTRSETPPLASNMLSVTAGSHAYRLLPHGEHFSTDQPAHIELAYEPLSVPHGFKPQDIHTYYFNEQTRQWQPLRRVTIDTVRHVVISETTHFTDFINAVIRTPDMPEVNAFVPTTLTDMEDPHPLSRVPMIAAPEANAYGTASITYPIDIPAGRNGLQPDLTLSYNSDRGNGIMGVGWSFPQPAITLDTRWGVPRYDANKETEIYTLNGLQLVQKDGNPDLRLPYQTNTQISRRTGDVLFIARDPKNADRIIRHGNSPKDYYWTVTDRSGTTYYYGKYAADRNATPNCVLKDANGNIAHWALAEVVDLYGNYMRYEYSVSEGNDIYMTDIYYTGHRNAQNTIDLKPTYHIRINYNDWRDDVIRNGRLGFVQTTDRAVCRISVAYINEYEEYEVVRAYQLEYHSGYNSRAYTGPQTLSKISDYDVLCAGNYFWYNDCYIDGRDECINGVIRFDYFAPTLDSLFSAQEVVIGNEEEKKHNSLNESRSHNWSVGGTLGVGLGTQVWNTNLGAGGNYNYSQSRGYTTSMFMDMNGDGLADMVYVKDDKIHYRLQHQEGDGILFEDEVNTDIPAKGLSQELSKTHTWGAQAGVETGVLNANISGGQSFTNTYTDSYFADINGDGLPDYVSDGVVYFNRLKAHSDFRQHTGEKVVKIDSSQCTTNFYYDGEVEIIPECYEKDTIIDTYTYIEPDCSLGYCGEPDIIDKPDPSFQDCEDCQDAIRNYVQGLDLQSQLATFNLQHALQQREDEGAPAEEKDLEQTVIHCLQNCGYELVCEACWNDYEVYLQNPEDTDLKQAYKDCMRDNGCRSICSECYTYLRDGNVDEYLYCADTYCLNGMLQGMENPCDDCREICIDDIDSCRKCIDSNPTCFVCWDCINDCAGGDPMQCNQCKLDYNCVGAIDNNSECAQTCLEADDTDDYSTCNECLREQGLYCDQCAEICHNEPERCFNCVNRHCHYDNTEAYQSACRTLAWNDYNAWVERIKRQYSNVYIEQDGNRYYAHQRRTICPQQTDPNIEAVRVWVAPRSGIVSINSTIQLLQDTTLSRRQSRTVDGVQCIIQHEQSVTANAGNGTLRSSKTTKIDDVTIGANDYTAHSTTHSSIRVNKGDVFFFRLMSVRTHYFDNVDWQQVITYSDNNKQYDSNVDYTCADSRMFQTDTTGTVKLDIQVGCHTGTEASLRIVCGNQSVTRPITSSVSYLPVSFSNLSANTSVYMELSPVTDNLGQTDIRARLTFVRSTGDTTITWIAPRLQFTPEVALDSTYYDLFGPLYRGWGQFAYNNTASAVTNIPLSSLSNTAKRYVINHPDTTGFTDRITGIDTSQLTSMDGFNRQMQSADLYNPLNHAWIEMTADAEHQRWEAYGKVARIGRNLQSNTRDTRTQRISLATTTGTTIEEDDEDIPDYDSEVPVSSNGQRVTTVRKVSRTESWNVNAGVSSFVSGAGYTHSESDYTVTTDFLDMNGDRYPDIVRPTSIQFTQPWGGLGAVRKTTTDVYTNHSVTNGASASGNYAGSVKLPGSNARDGKFSLQVGGALGNSNTASTNDAIIAYIDINGDGLPDKIVQRNGVVLASLNIGYGFAREDTLYGLTAINQNVSTYLSYNAGADASWESVISALGKALGSKTGVNKFQMSLSLGADIGWSVDNATVRLTDMDGDGLPDLVMQRGNDIMIGLMTHSGTGDQSTTIANQSSQSRKTLNWNINAAITGGVTFLLWKLNIGGRGSYGQSVSRTHADLIDMNGDGLPDLVWTDNDGNIHVRYNQMGKRHLLRTITNPTGQQFHLHYTLSEPDTEQRSRQWLLTQVDDVIAHTGALTCDTITRCFAYADPHYDAAERTPLGYGVVETHDINTMEQPHSLYRRHIRRYQNADFVEHGKLLYDALTDALGNRYTEYKLDILYHDSTGVTDNLCQDITIRVGKESHITTYFEGGQDSIVTAKQYDYDRYHNVVAYRNLGDANIGDDDLSATITYRDATSGSNLANNLVSLPTGVTISANQTKVRKDTATYDGKGSLTQYKQTDLTTGNARTTDYSYNDYGKVETILLPENDNGQRASYTIEYDGYSQSLPARVTNQWGHTSSISYHRYWQLPTATTDVAGETIEYDYDKFGRLTSITAPKDKAQNKHTIWYEYQRNCGWDYYDGRVKELGTRPSYIDVHTYSGGDSTLHRTFCDARGDMVQRFDRRHHRYVLSNQVQRDCFGRDVTSLKNVWIYSGLPTSYYTSNAAIRVQTDYDILDRPITTHWADGAESSISYGIGNDAFGISRLLQNRTDENGNEWQQYSSPQGWLTTSVAPDEATTTFRYDALGQLLQSTAPDGMITTHTYDGFGRRTERVHPDAGTTRWTYDAAGNMIASATQMQLNRGEQTIYEYDYTRPVYIHYPHYPQNDIHYAYNSVGRLALVRDVTGVERMMYDAMGNVSESNKIIAVPTENMAYNLVTKYRYDSFGRMQQIVYPDGEVVNYNYRNGLLCSVTGDASMPYIRDISYDLYGNISYIQYGNGLQTNIFYDDVHLRPYNRQTYTGQDVPLQDISYTYDGVGNITRINQSVDPFGNMGGAYDVRYTYDDQYRLTRAVQSSSQLGGYDYSMSYSPSGLVSTKDCQEINTSLTYGYQYNSDNRVSPFASHRVATVFPTNTDEVALTVWNANGELTSIVQPFQDNFRRHLWNEAGQLSLFISNEYCGYYAYDAQGNRAYKLTGTVVADQYDAGTMQVTAYFDDATLYVNPYMVVTPRGYTKHYYNGSQRIAARLGGQWTQDSTLVQKTQLIAQAESLWERVTNTEDLGEQNILSADVYVGGNRQVLPACQYSPQIAQLSGYHEDDILSRVFSGQASERTLTDTIGIYFYHPDHLGSASWITNSQGQAVQYIHYMPYGELWVNQQANSYDERFKFTGKERDAETGYDYFGARYYSSMLGHWLSVDKLADDYPHITPYAQSAWNPIKYKDPDGNFVGTAIDIICVGMDIYSLAKNLAEGNTQAALVDAGALAIDALAVLVPGVTAGAGIAVKAARAADKGKDVVTVSKQIEKAGRVIPPNGGKAKPHGGQVHNAKIDDFIQGLGDDVSNIRKNQTQVDVSGKKVGSNRPDVQYDKDGVHYNVEFDINAKNSSKHGDVIQHNDPNSKVILNVIEK